MCRRYRCSTAFPLTRGDGVFVRVYVCVCVCTRYLPQIPMVPRIVSRDVAIIRPIVRETTRTQFTKIVERRLRWRSSIVAVQRKRDKGKDTGRLRRVFREPA